MAYLSCGPSRKYPTYDPTLFTAETLQRARGAAYTVDLEREVVARLGHCLDLPDGYRVCLVPGGCTGAMLSVMWNLLLGSRARPTTVYTLCYFSHLWRDEIAKMRQDVRWIPGASTRCPEDCNVLWVANSTTHGYLLPRPEGAAECAGLRVADLTSLVFNAPVDWGTVDAGVFSLQKVLGADAGLGVVVLSPRAWLEVDPTGTMPRLFALGDRSVNTLSMLALHDALAAMRWWLDARPEAYCRHHEAFDALPFLTRARIPPDTLSSPYSPSYQLDRHIDVEDFIAQCEARGVHDIRAHFNNTYHADIRVWCGCTVPESEVLAAVAVMREVVDDQST